MEIMKAGKFSKSKPINFTLGQMNEASEEENISRTDKKGKMFKTSSRKSKEGNIMRSWKMEAEH